MSWELWGMLVYNPRVAEKTRRCIAAECCVCVNVSTENRWCDRGVGFGLLERRPSYNRTSNDISIEGEVDANCVALRSAIGTSLPIFDIRMH